jgi:hypothetical protein
MPKRANPRGCQFERGFLVGMLYGRGSPITTARIRKLFRVHRSTAKRDMKVIRKIVPVLPSKPFIGCKVHQPQRTVKRAAS